MQDSVCMCVTKFLIKDMYVWRVLTVIRSHKTFINSQTLGSHIVNNENLFVCTAFIYSSESCQVSESPHPSKAVTTLGQSERAMYESRTKESKPEMCETDEGRE